MASPRLLRSEPVVTQAGVLSKTPHIGEPSKLASGTPTRQSTTRRTPTMAAMTR